jgi:hypothetical protein
MVSRSRIQLFSILDPGSEFFHPGSPLKNLSILTKKMVSQALGNMIRVVHPGSRIPDPDPDFLHFPDHGYRGQKGTGSWNQIRNADGYRYHLSCRSRFH